MPYFDFRRNSVPINSAVLFLLLISVILCIADEVPYAALLVKYPGTEYFVGIGESPAGTDRSGIRTAEIRAREELAKLIRVRVESEMIDKMCAGKAAGCENGVKETIRTTVDEHLQGSAIAGRGQEKGMAWAVAVMPRALLAAIRENVGKPVEKTGMSAEIVELPDGMRDDRIRREIVAEASCAIVGMSAEQAQHIALQRARTAAIEKAAGIQVASAAVVTDAHLVGDFIKTYSRGHIVREEKEWLDGRWHKISIDGPPVPEYRVKITADVRIPERKTAPLGLQAELGRAVLADGDEFGLEARVARTACVAVFNLTPDDKITMVFPNTYQPDCTVKGKIDLPGPDVKYEAALSPGRERDTEALIVVAVDPSRKPDVEAKFRAGAPMAFDKFFGAFAELSDFAEEIILPYEIVRKR